MKNSSFYDLTSVSFSDRETFSNTILLLSMVKSEAYYIIGFSRLDKKIEIGFDFTSSLNSIITETFTMDLNDPTHICFKAVLKNLNTKQCRQITDDFNGDFYVCGDDIIYESCIERDEIIPISIEKVDNTIKNVKQEIIDFIEDCFKAGLQGCY